MRFSVSILSSNPIASLGLTRIIESEGVRVLSSSPSIEELVPHDTALPDLVIIDLPTLEQTLEAIDKLNQSNLVVLDELFDLRAMTKCFARGAHGYLVKNVSCAALMASLHLASLGQKLIPSELADAIPQGLSAASIGADRHPSSNEAQLSQRELLVLNGLMEGQSNKVIARKLEVTEATIKVHVKAIFRKLKVENRTQAALWVQSRTIGMQAMESAS